MSLTITDELLETLIQAVEDERSEAKALSTSFALGRGVKVPTASQRILYSFTLANAPQLHDEARGRLTVGGATVECVVVSRRSDGLDVSTFVDLGEDLSSATLTVDRSEILSTLAARLEMVKSGQATFPFNRSIAAHVLDHASIPPGGESPFVAAPDDLTEDQQEAYRRALCNSVTYLWGPPGTGKTVTVSAIAFNLFAHNKRVLVVSHTNRAVDGVVLGLCKRIVGRARTAIPEGSVVRIGAISRKGLSSTFGNQISLDALAELQQRKVKERIGSVKKEHEVVQQELANLRHQYGLSARLKVLGDELVNLQRLLEEARTNERGLDTVLRVLRIRYGTGQGRAGSVEEIKRSIKAVTAEILDVTTESSAAASPEEVSYQISDAESRLKDLDETVRDLEALGEDASGSALQRARVVACTAAQAVLRCAQLGEFDAVIIDEASMLPLPYVIFLSGLAREKVVVGGDFRQLPPISLASTPNVRQWFSRDIFEAAGIVDLVDRAESSPSLASLTTQFRGHAQLCSLINERFYAGRLKPKNSEAPVLEGESPQAALPSWLVASGCMLVDTSGLKPVGHFDNRSKVNLPHALVVRDICATLRDAGLLRGLADVGVVSPYRPQVSLIEDLLDEAGIDSVAVGTAHRFQGAERNTIVVDLTESAPHTVGSFLGATSLRDAGAKLLNVSLSRAHVRLIVVANLSYLNEQLSEGHILRGVLDDMQRIGPIVGARDVLVDAVSGAATSGADGHTSQRFDEQTFLAGLSADIRESRSSIDVTSGRVTSRAAHIFATIMRPVVDRGVAVQVTTSNPTSGAEGDDARLGISVLEDAGLRVVATTEELYDGCVIDGEVVWIGNVSILDCIDRNELVMTRVVSEVAGRMLSKLLGAGGRCEQVRPLAANA